MQILNEVKFPVFVFIFDLPLHDTLVLIGGGDNFIILKVLDALYGGGVA